MGLLPPQLIPRFDTSLERILLLIYPLCLLPVFLLLWAEGRHQKQLRINPRGCKKLGLRGYSNLSDEYSPIYAKPALLSPDGKSSEPWKIKALFIHPIKSCAPVELNIADLSSTGLTWDRQFCFAEYRIPSVFPPGFSASEKKQLGWTFSTLRNKGYEKLVHVRPEVWVPDSEYVRINRIGDPNLDGELVINYPNIPRGTYFERLLLKAGQILHLTPKENSFRVPLLPPKNHTYPLESISIWHDIPLALNYSRHVPLDFKAYLEIPADTPFTLFRASPLHYREVHRSAPRHGTGEGEVQYQPITAFADAYPLHLLNLASVRDVADKVKQHLSVFTAKRFRANIIVTGPPAYDEDDWKRVRVLPNHPPPPPLPPPTLPAAAHTPTQPEPGEIQPVVVDLYTACHTIRCRLPNVDPATGTRHDSEPDRTLRSFRCIDRGETKKAALGLQMVPARAGAMAGGGGGEGEGEAGQEHKPMRISVGDQIEVLERGELVYIRA